MKDLENELSIFIQKNYIRNPEVTFKKFVMDRIEFLLKKDFKKESEIYQRGNIDRKVYYNLKHGDDYYRPVKTMALAYCIALGLSVTDAEKLLYAGGYHFEESSLTDQVVKFCLKNRIYSADAVNSYILHCATVFNIDKAEYIGSHAKEWSVDL